MIMMNISVQIKMIKRGVFLTCSAIYLLSMFSNCGADEELLKRQYRSALAAYARQDMAEAEAGFRFIHETNPEYGRTRLMLARTLIFRENYDDAVDLLEEAIDDSPANLDALYWLAKILSRDPEKVTESLALLDRVLAGHSGHIDALILKGDLLARQGNIKKALTTYRGALLNEAKLSAVHARIGNIYRGAGLDDNARGEFNRAGEVSGKN